MTDDPKTAAPGAAPGPGRTIQVPPGERGLVRLFSLSLPAAQAEALRDTPAKGPDPLAALLGLPALDRDRAELVSLADLAGLGLPTYLTEGMGLLAGPVDSDRARLAALEGQVLLLHSAAFDGQGATLRPAPALTLIGTYPEPRADHSLRPMTSEAARPYTGTPKPHPSERQGRVPAGSGTLIVIGAALMALAWWLLR